MKQPWGPPPPHVGSNTDLAGWPRSGAGVPRAAGVTQERAGGPRRGWLCWGRLALGWCPQGPGSCRRGPPQGRRGCSAGPRAQGRTHSLVGSGPPPPARLQSGPHCTAEHRPLQGGGREQAAKFIVAKAWCAVPQLTAGGEGLVPSGSSWLCSSPHPTPCPALSPSNRDGRQGHSDCSPPSKSLPPR